jgi:RNA polymerase sigma factor (sigma-70 family)
MQDDFIINGLKNAHENRGYFEKEFYMAYSYFIKEGCRKYHITYEDSFSAYSDALLSAIQNIASGTFDHQYSIKTYLYQIFRNKCVDLIRKNTTNKQGANQSETAPDLLNFLPDKAKDVIGKLIDQEQIQNLRLQLEKSGEKCRDLLLLFEDGYSDKEIADKLSYNNAAVVKTTRLRCREKLRNLLSGYE